MTWRMKHRLYHCMTETTSVVAEELPLMSAHLSEVVFLGFIYVK